MRYRNFGNTNLLASEIGFGAWAIGGGAMIGSTAIGWGETNDEESINAIHAALDAGINFFDTADVYGLGHSESLLGRAIGERKEIIIATKVGNVARDEKFTTDYSYNHIIAACERSLKRLRRNEIDFYQLHSARLKQLQDGECIQAMQALQQQGKIRYWGLSLNTFEPDPEGFFMVEKELGHGFQLVLNIINQRALTLVKRAGDNGFGIIARMPLQFGLLTGKFDIRSSFTSNDHRSKRLPPQLISQVNTTLAPVWALCSKYNCSKTELALSYVLSYPEISTAIAGMRTAEQVKQNTGGIFLIDDSDRAMIESLANTELTELMNSIQQLG